jgi:cation:H+ antiporter
VSPLTRNRYYTLPVWTRLLAIAAGFGLLVRGGAVLTRGYPVLAGFTVALLIMAYGFRTWGHINRPEGGLLLGGYPAYQTLLYFTARS